MAREILTARLGARKETDGPTVGWIEGMSTADAWEHGRSWWRMNPGRAIECELMLILDPDYTVIAVGTIDGLMKGENYSEFKRAEIVGEVIDDHEYMGCTVNRTGSQNPISYVTDRDIIAPTDS